MKSGKPDIKGAAADLRRLVQQADPPGLLTRILNLF
jgi:hypothetical protein